MIVYRLTFLSLIMLLAASYTMLSQCPPNDSCGQWNPTITVTTTTFNPGCTATIYYRTRECNGVVEYDIIDMAYQGLCEDLNNLDIEHYHYKGIVDYLTMIVITRDLLHTNIPPCGSNDRIQIANIYMASCGIWVSCEYTVDPDSRQCDQGYDEPFPAYGSDGVTKVKMYKWQPCGTTCCRRVYSICADGFRPSLPALLRATLISKEKLTECSDRYNYGSAQDCLDGC